MPKSLEQVRQQLANEDNGDFDFTRHALRRAAERNIGGSSNPAGRVKRGSDLGIPRSQILAQRLVTGFAMEGRPLHIQASLTDTEFVKIVTIYDPDPEEWIDYFVRRQR